MNDKTCDFSHDPDLLAIETYAEILGTTNNLLETAQLLSDASLALALDNPEMLQRFQNGLDSLTEGLINFGTAFWLYAEAHGITLSREHRSDDR